MTRKAIEKKQEQVEVLTQQMQEARSVVIVDYLGLTVDQVTKLRVELLNNGCEFKVLKNNIIRRAAEQAGYGEMVEHITGPNAVALSHEDSVSAAKVIYDFAKNNKKLELKVGVVDDQFMDHDKIETIATIPPREVLLTMIAGGILEPIKNVAIALSLHAENLEENNG